MSRFNQYFLEEYLDGKIEEYSKLKKDFTNEEKEILRPIAEVLAMLDGNAFFTCEWKENKEWYEMYLPEANLIYESNGGNKGWAGEASFAKKVLNA